MKRTLLLASTALATAALSTTSVAQADNAGPRTPPPVLTGVAWHARTITENGVTHTVPEGSRAGLTFDADRRTVAGHDGCNGFSGEAVVDAERSTVTFGSEYASTMIACYPPDHVDLIPSAGTYEARVTAHTLTLTGPDGHVITLGR